MSYDLSKFSERKRYSNKAEDFFYEYCDLNGIEHKPVVSREEWEAVKDLPHEHPEKMKLQNKDLRQGDAIVKYKHICENIDVKRNTITIHSLEYFEHNYYVVYHANLGEAIVVKKDDVKNITLDGIEFIRVDSNGQKIYGIKYNTLLKIDHMSLDKFFGIKNTKYIWKADPELVLSSKPLVFEKKFEKNPLSTEEAEDDIVLHFSDGSKSERVKAKIYSINAYIKGTDYKNKGKKYVIGYTKNGIYHDV